MIEEVKDQKKVVAPATAGKERRIADVPQNPGDPIEFPLHPSMMLFNGKSCSGKSVCMKRIIYDFVKRGYFKKILIFCTTKSNGSWNIFKHQEEYDKYVKDRYDEKVLEKYVQFLKDYFVQHKVALPNLIVFDDCQGVLTKHTPFFENFLCTFRHLGCTLMFASQYMAQGLSTTMREQAGYAFIWQPAQHRAYLSLSEAFGTYFYKTENEEYIPSKREADKAFKSLLNEAHKQDYQCLLYLGDKKSKEEGYAFFTAEPAPEFKASFGSKKKHPALASKSVMDIMNADKKKR